MTVDGCISAGICMGRVQNRRNLLWGRVLTPTTLSYKVHGKIEPKSTGRQLHPHRVRGVGPALPPRSIELLNRLYLAPPTAVDAL